MEFSSSKRPATTATAAESVHFRLLCPASRTGAIIGKGGSVIRHLQSVTGSKIRVIDDIPVPSEERVVLIIAPSGKKKDDSNVCDSENHSSEEPKQEKGSELAGTSGGDDEEAPSSAQMALLRVLERIVFGDDAASVDGDELDKGESESLCRMIVRGNQVDFLMSKGGKMIQKIREDSGAIVRISSTDQIPPCAFPGDVVIQITGKFSSVKKALLLITNCLQETGAPPTWDECPFPQPGYPPDYHSMEYHPQWDHPPNPMPEDVGPFNRPVVEEEVAFRLLCPADKVGSLIGKGGAVVRALQNESGASIKVSDPTHDSEERIIVISARENLERRNSLAQDGVMRVHNRIVEIGFEPSAAVVARLLVHSPYIGRLLGKGGHLISEMRRATGASIRVFAKDQATKYESQHDEIVQVIGNLKTVQDALFQILCRLREAMFPGRLPFQGLGGPPPPFMGPYPEPPPPFGPRQYPASPDRYHSPVGSFHERHCHGPGFDRPPGPGFDRPPSPMSWTPQPGIDGHPGGMVPPDVNHGFALRNEPIGSENPAMTSANVEIVIPQAYLGHVYGENCSNLNYIKQVSGANVVVHDPKAGTTEGLVVVSGTSDQAHFAQSLLHAFILCGQS
ncbi:K Homology domain type 1 superfamily [Arabidopsis thaliana x Arabidopsis arenosa]|uniref:K Homology domain type 1 superfamily n=1 Tax=Arabidopsis thaliana x Arabidopsis arenosa TaxID=1240361 RepID=A0A8T2C9T8_9BRAS|nr:K Homology domain type 1 superfamily [Arabidopsis thaliana x Arabidopsis arenosa]